MSGVLSRFVRSTTLFSSWAGSMCLGMDILLVGGVYVSRNGHSHQCSGCFRCGCSTALTQQLLLSWCTLAYMYIRVDVEVTGQPWHLSSEATHLVFVVVFLLFALRQ